MVEDIGCGYSVAGFASGGGALATWTGLLGRACHFRFSQSAFSVWLMWPVSSLRGLSLVGQSKFGFFSCWRSSAFL